jgi:D-amino-acid oxidase
LRMLALLPGEPVSSVAVVGCGALGLATARLLQERGLSVRIYASELPPNTTSNIAGGEWFPFGVFEFGKQSPEFMNQFLQAAEFSYRRYQIYLGPRYGVRWLRDFDLRYHPFNDSSLFGTIRPFLPEMRDLSESEHPFSGYPFVRQHEAMLA